LPTGKDAVVRPSDDLPVVRCVLAAHAGLVVSDEALATLRKNPGSLPAPLPAPFLKQADEQTVVGLAALCRAAQDHGLDLNRQADWGVIAAPELVGRTGMVAALQAFAKEGAWGISPHLIPHRSLHSLSGTVSQALGLHGPNYGVGGGPGAAAEALLAAAALLADGQLPGLWLILTGEVETRNETNFTWQAAALALVPGAETTGELPGLAIGVGSFDCSPTSCLAASHRQPQAPAIAGGSRLNEKREKEETKVPAFWPLFTLEALLTLLMNNRDLPAARWRLGPGGWVRLQPATEGKP
jgi:hypothetical protein